MRDGCVKDHFDSMKLDCFTLCQRYYLYLRLAVQHKFDVYVCVWDCKWSDCDIWLSETVVNVLFVLRGENINTNFIVVRRFRAKFVFDAFLQKLHCFILFLQKKHNSMLYDPLRAVSSVSAAYCIYSYCRIKMVISVIIKAHHLSIIPVCKGRGFVSHTLYQFLKIAT